MVMAKPTGRKRGGQPGNRNALKTGLHTRQMRDMRRTARLRIAALKAAAAWANMVLALNQACHPRRLSRRSLGEGGRRPPYRHAISPTPHLLRTASCTARNPNLGNPEPGTRNRLANLFRQSSIGAAAEAPFGSDGGPPRHHTFPRI